MADAGFTSFDNLEYCEEKGINVLIPDRHLEVEEQGLTAKGEYDRSRFKYDQNQDQYLCPQGQLLYCLGKTISNGRSAKRYGNPQACRQCPVRTKCTRGKHRIIIRDDKEYLKEQMQQKLSLLENKEIYNLRAHSAEAPIGCVKWNWKFISFLRRTIPKVCVECALLFALHNILKIGAV